MGNDGGTIAKRLDVLSLHSTLDAGSSKPVPVDQGVCSLSALPLRGEVVVGDARGRLYLKQKLLEHILDGKTTPNTPAALHDMVEVRLCWDGAIVCPVSSRHDHLCYLRPCGCVVLHRLLQQLSATGESACPRCSTAFAANLDIVLLDQTDDAAAHNELTLQRLAAMGLHHSKRPRKRKNLAGRPRAKARKTTPKSP